MSWAAQFDSEILKALFNSRLAIAITYLEPRNKTPKG